MPHQGEVLENSVTKTREKKAALKLRKQAILKHGRAAVFVADRLCACGAAPKQIGAGGRQETGRWMNDRAQNPHLPCRRRKRATLRFRRMRSLQKIATAHASVYNQFNQERSLCSRNNFKLHRASTFDQCCGFCIEEGAAILPLRRLVRLRVSSTATNLLSSLCKACRLFGLVGTQHADFIHRPFDRACIHEREGRRSDAPRKTNPSH